MLYNLCMFYSESVVNVREIFERLFIGIKAQAISPNTDTVCIHTIPCFKGGFGNFCNIFLRDAQKAPVFMIIFI